MTRFLLAPLFVLAACGSSGGPSSSPPANKPTTPTTTTAPATADDPAWASKIDHVLADRIAAARSTDKIQIALWLDVALVEDPNKATSAMSPSVIENGTRISAAATQAESVIKGLGITFTGSMSTVPLVFAEATPDQIRTLAKRAEFVRIDFNDTTGIDDAT